MEGLESAYEYGNVVFVCHGNSYSWRCVFGVYPLTDVFITASVGCVKLFSTIALLHVKPVSVNWLIYRIQISWQNFRQCKKGFDPGVNLN